uniref:RNA exonuclease n=1 Tax=Rhizophora mucronata TaxID=61149 RepID=A0A2P2IN42_RHIMU
MDEKKKKGGGTQEKKISKQKLALNPNWVQLQQKLKSHGSKPSKQSKESKNRAQESILGKRKERADVESVDSHSSPLTPTNDDFRCHYFFMWYFIA